MTETSPALTSRAVESSTASPWSMGRYKTVDDPHAGTAAGEGTALCSVNNNGVAAGALVDAHGDHHGFLDRSGHLSALINDPLAANGSGLGTESFGINDSGEVGGPVLRRRRRAPRVHPDPGTLHHDRRPQWFDRQLGPGPVRHRRARRLLHRRKQRGARLRLHPRRGLTADVNPLTSLVSTGAPGSYHARQPHAPLRQESPGTFLGLVHDLQYGYGRRPIQGSANGR